MPSTIVNSCKCCGTDYTQAAFDALPLLMERTVEEDTTVFHEVMRNCECGSTRMTITETPKN